MLFDFIFETKDLPDGIKALLARLQIPVLKAAMLDGAFFAKKTASVAPARERPGARRTRLVDRRWGTTTRSFARSTRSSTRSSTTFPTTSRIFDEQREVAQGVPRRGREGQPKRTSTSCRRDPPKDRYRSLRSLAKAEIERRVEASPVPNFLATFLRQKGKARSSTIYVGQGEESDAWTAGITTLEDLVWSVQPKRSVEDRRHLVALLPSLLKRFQRACKAAAGRSTSASRSCRTWSKRTRPRSSGRCRRTGRRPRRSPDARHLRREAVQAIDGPSTSP